MENGFCIKDNMRNCKEYDGITTKFGITVDNKDYIVKKSGGNESAVYSEYVASRFIGELGVNSHKVWMGYHNGELVNILLDFTTSESKLKAYKDIRQSSEGTDVESKSYTYSDVEYMIDKNIKMSKSSKSSKDSIIDAFWQMFVCDAILANRDRHWGNWGYLVTGDNYEPAPIYDNGACLFPDVNKRINDYKKDRYRFIADRSESFPASLLMLKRDTGELKRTNYYEIIGTPGFNDRLTSKLENIKKNADLSGIQRRIENVLQETKSIIPYEYRLFYDMLICVRYLHIVERMDMQSAYNKALEEIDHAGSKL